MLIAQQKRKENIIEYILYMFQVEDTLRACQFNMDMIEDKVISQYQVSEKVKMDIRDWYTNLIVMMHEEGVKESGHISMLRTVISDLESLHQKLINEIKDPGYLEQYGFARQNIRDFEKKLGADPVSEVHTCLTALYALLLLRLQKKKISEETRAAMQTFSNLLARLGVKYKKLENGEMEI